MELILIEFLLALLFLITIVAAMSVGVMGGRAPITGTCGGLNNLSVDAECEICGGNPGRCQASRPD